MSSGGPGVEFSGDEIAASSSVRTALISMFVFVCAVDLYSFTVSDSRHVISVRSVRWCCAVRLCSVFHLSEIGIVVRACPCCT